MGMTYPLSIFDHLLKWTLCVEFFRKQFVNMETSVALPCGPELHRFMKHNTNSRKPRPGPQHVVVIIRLLISKARF